MPAEIESLGAPRSRHISLRRREGRETPVENFRTASPPRHQLLLQLSSHELSLACRVLEGGRVSTLFCIEASTDLRGRSPFVRDKIEQVSSDRTEAAGCDGDRGIWERIVVQLPLQAASFDFIRSNRRGN